MVVFCCPKCKMVDIGEENEQKSCMQCGIPMLSLGITSGEWNKLNDEQMKSCIEGCLAANEESSPVQPDIIEENESPLYEEPIIQADDNHIEPDYTEPEMVDQEDMAYMPVEIENPATPVYDNTPVDPQPIPQPQRSGAVSKKKVVTVDRSTSAQGAVSKPLTSTTKAARNTYPVTDNYGSFSKLAIVGLILSVFGCTSIAGIIIGIIDLTKKDGRKHALSYASIIVGSMMLVGALGFASLQTNKNKADNYDRVAEEIVETVETPVPTAEPTQEAIEESSNDDQNETQEIIEEETPEQSQPIESKYDTISSGVYVIGEDFPVGTYAFHTLRGRGKFFIYDSYDKYRDDSSRVEDIATYHIKASDASRGAYQKDIFTEYIYVDLIKEGMCIAIEDGPTVEYTDNIAEFGINNVIVPGIYIVGQDIDAGKYSFKAIEGRGRFLVTESFDKLFDSNFDLRSVIENRIKSPDADRGGYSEDVFTDSLSGVRLEEGQCILVEDGVKLAYDEDYSYPLNTEGSTPVESDDSSDESSDEEVEEVSTAEDSNNPYASIYEEYAQKLRDATPGLIKEYKNEVKSNNKGMEGKAEIANSKVEKLANISNEGVEKMATAMWTKGSGNYDEYSDWSSKLYDVYSEEADKIYNEYMK